MPIMLRNKKMQKILDNIIGQPSNMAKVKLTRKDSKLNKELVQQESSRLR
jgi:5-hydroxyisourate hydrolase-like protein (transthyretin family)